MVIFKIVLFIKIIKIEKDFTDEIRNLKDRCRNVLSQNDPIYRSCHQLYQVIAMDCAQLSMINRIVATTNEYFDLIPIIENIIEELDDIRDTIEYGMPGLRNKFMRFINRVKQFMNRQINRLSLGQSISRLRLKW